MNHWGCFESMHVVSGTLHSPGPTWTPSTPGNVVAWFRADTGVTLSGSNVTAWADQSGNGQNISSGGAPPTYSSTGWNSSKPAIVFSPTQYLQRTSGTLTTFMNGTGKSFTVFATFNVTSTTNARVFTEWDNGATDYMQQYIASNHKFTGDDGVIGNTITGTNTVDGANKTYACMVGSGTANVYFNSSLEVNGGAYATSNFTSLNRFLLGTNFLGTAGFDGPIVEVVIYSSKLTSTDYGNYQTWASSVWGGV